MLYPLIFAIVVFYLAMSHVSYRYFERVKRAWFGDHFKRFKPGEIFEAVVWPITLPAFYSSMRKEIKAVKEGRDWADVNLPENRRDKFREGYMRDTQ